ncbi:Endonuclease/exonuclease/phosphatase [Gossypium australe]|uniref:Endonuclease/exonuclease/phosphatase n=1 Tax=Gossypium australe TaxID=47621 RepID=A0A5B6WDU8_9ROSI|nr:Endonuclease/exonuclease/phosphatase [Gossypium australe]
MEQDKEDGVLIGEEGKKRARGEMDNMIVLVDEKTSAGRNRRVLEVNQFVSTAAKRQVDRWNVRELGSPRAVRRLRYMLKLQNPQMVFFMETKICRSKMERIRYSCGYINGIEVDPEGTRGGLCLAWKQGVSVTLRQFSERHIDAVIDDDELRGKWRFTGFYGSPYEHDRSNSWAELRSLYT